MQVYRTSHEIKYRTAMLDQSQHRIFHIGVLDLDLPDLPAQADQLHVAAKYLGDHVAELRLAPQSHLLDIQ